MTTEHTSTDEATRRDGAPLTEGLGLTVGRAYPLVICSNETRFQQVPVTITFQQRVYSQAELDAAVAAERERCARVCDDEARIRTEVGEKHPEDSESRGRCFAAARAAINCAKGCRNGEEV